MKSEAQKKATAKYREKGMRLTIEFFPGTEKELIDHINNQPKKATYIKQLIKDDIAKEYGEEWIWPNHLILVRSFLPYTKIEYLPLPKLPSHSIHFRDNIRRSTNSADDASKTHKLGNIYFRLFAV